MLEQHMPKMPFDINAQYIKDLSFESKDPLKYFSVNKHRLDMRVNVDVQANSVAELVFEVCLLVNVKVMVKKDVAFIFELSYCGLFSFDKDIDETRIKPFLLIECPGLLFPFVRHIVLKVTGDAGFAPLSLTPIDFSVLYHQQHTPQNEIK